MAKCPYMILERALVLEIRSTKAIPKLTAVLLMCPPVTSDCQGLSTFATFERLDAMLSLVMRLQCTKILKGLSTRVVDIVPASSCAAVAW